MFARKRPLIPERIRRPPMQGWSWIDRRFVHRHAPLLSRDAIMLYFFLAAVSDKEGLSYWGDPRLSALLQLSEPALAEARSELEHYDLIAYDAPVCQVLSLPPPLRRTASHPGPISLKELFGKFAARPSAQEKQHDTGEGCPP